jgi:hypothetical protein
LKASNNCIEKDTVIEVKLSLLEEIDSTRHDISISLNISNHSNQAVYVPSLGAQALDGIVVFKEGRGDTGYINIPFYSDSIIIHSMHNFPALKSNEIDKTYRESSKAIFWSQEQIFTDYIDENPDQRVRLPEIAERPVYLKANETINNFIVLGCNHFLGLPGDYKIYFRFNKKIISSIWPKYIGIFKLLVPESFVSNSVYFSN